MPETSATVALEHAANQDPHAPRRRGPDQAALDMFLGKWTIVGTNVSLINGKREPVHGTRDYRRVDGAYFMSGNFTHEAESGSHIGVSVMGANEHGNGWFVHNYDNLGFAREYSMTVKGRTWTLTGRYERAVCEFAADGNAFTERWELSKDGVTWAPLCEMRAMRQRD